MSRTQRQLHMLIQTVAKFCPTYLIINLRSIQATKLHLKPIYDSIVLLTSNCDASGYCAQGVTPQIRWWVQLGSTEMLIDQDGKKIKSPEVIRAFFESLFFEDTLLMAEMDRIRVFPVLDYTPSLHFLRGLTLEQIRRKRTGLWTNQILKQTVLDTVMELWKAKAPEPQHLIRSYYFGVGGPQSKKEQKLMADCNCARSMYYRKTSRTTFRLQAIGAQFVSMAHYYESMNYGWQLMFSSKTFFRPILFPWKNSSSHSKNATISN